MLLVRVSGSGPLLGGELYEVVVLGGSAHATRDANHGSLLEEYRQVRDVFHLVHPEVTVVLHGVRASILHFEGQGVRRSGPCGQEEGGGLHRLRGRQGHVGVLHRDGGVDHDNGVSQGPRHIRGADLGRVGDSQAGHGDPVTRTVPLSGVQVEGLEVRVKVRRVEGVDTRTAAVVRVPGARSGLAGGRVSDGGECVRTGHAVPEVDTRGINRAAVEVRKGVRPRRGLQGVHEDRVGARSLPRSELVGLG